MNSVFAATCIAASCIMTPYEPSVAAQPAASSVGTLEETIVRLESAGTRADTVQGLADVFEAAGSQTLRARTKFKYVSGRSYIERLFFHDSYISYTSV
jgi:hypothetical protein